jgi:hypothetical protein
MSRNNSHFFVIKKTHPTVNNTGQTHRYTQSKGKSQSVDALAYFKQKMITNGELIRAPAGIYTWIMVDDDFYATRVISKQEIGTMHRDLYRFSDSRTHNQSDIIAAGELEIKEDRHVDFNFLSGTYYKKFTKGKIQNNMSELSDIVKSKIESFGFDDIEYINERAIINTANIRATRNNVRILNTYFNKEGGRRGRNRNGTKKRVRKG